MKRITFSFIFVLSVLFVSANAQVMQDNEGITVLLEKSSAVKKMSFFDVVAPYNKNYIYALVDSLNKPYSGLTSLDRANLSFYMSDFFFESQITDSVKQDSVYMGFFKHDPAGRLRAFYYSDDKFKIAVDPIYGYARGYRDGESLTHFWSGLAFYGYLGKNVNFYFNYRDNAETGKTLDRKKQFTPDDGISLYTDNPDHIEYSDVRTGVSYFGKWGAVSVMKDYINWGYGESGKLIMSSKAPSMPMVRLDLNLTDWLQFNYFHAWLASDVADSSSFYDSFVEGEPRVIYRDKYMASHSFIIRPMRGLSIAIGESIVYADALKFAYLQPLMFFRLADHYLSRADNSAGDNSQFFAQVSAKGLIPNTHLYAEGLIDEIKMGELFNPEKQRNQIGFTLGGSVYDLPIENLTATFEYTKVYPFAYKHYIPTLTYESSSYVMGHWIGQNADIIYGSLKYGFMRGLNAKAWGFYTRKGGEGTAEQQLNVNIPQPPFLHGLRTNYTQLGFEAKYEFINNLFARAELIYNKISSEQEDGSFINNNYNEFSFAVYYGL